MRETIARLFEALLASFKTHKWWWAGGGGAAVVAIAAAAVFMYGGFFGPDGGAICKVALDHARDYGVVPGDASLASSSPKKTDVKDRWLCTALADNNEFNLTVDMTCKDLKNKDCVSLYNVARADGMTTYQVRQVPDDDNDAALDMGNQADDAGNTQSAAGAPDAGAAPDANDVAPATGLQADPSDQTQGAAAAQQDAPPQQ